jgi:hypothetical protein
VIESEQQAASLSSTTVVVKETSLAEETIKEGVQKGLKQLQVCSTVYVPVCMSLLMPT